MKKIIFIFFIFSISLFGNSNNLNISEAIDTLNKATVKLIKNQENVKTVLIIKAKEVDLKANEYAEILKRRFLSFEEKTMIKQLLKELSRYTVDIRIANLVKNRPCTFSDVYGVNLDWYVVQFDELKNYYNETGFTTESPQAFVY